MSKTPTEFIPRRERYPKTTVNGSIVGAFAITLLLGGIVFASSTNHDTPTTFSKINLKTNNQHNHPFSQSDTASKHVVRKPTQDKQTKESATMTPSKHENSHYQDVSSDQETVSSQYHSKNTQTITVSNTYKPKSQKQSSLKQAKNQQPKTQRQTRTASKTKERKPAQPDAERSETIVTPGNSSDPSQDQNPPPTPAPEENTPPKKGVLSPILQTLKIKETLSIIIPNQEKTRQ